MKRSVTDEKGREWVIAINVLALKRIKESAGVNLGVIPKGELLPLLEWAETQQQEGGIDALDMTTGMELLAKVDNTRLGQVANDTLLFSDVLWGILRVQAQERQIEQEAFFDMLEPEFVAECQEKFWAAYVDFFRRGSQKQLAPLVEIFAQLQDMLNVGAASLSKSTDGSPQKADESVSNSPVESTSGNLSTGPLGSLGLTPDLSPPVS